MSKPISRVVFSVLIALALVVGIYTSVLGAPQNAGPKLGRAQVDSSLILSQGHHRTLGQELDSFEVQSEPYDQPKHDCDSESMTNPEDY